MTVKNLTRKEIYRKFLKAKGRYDFWYAMNLTDFGEHVMFDEPHPYKKIIDWILQGKEVIFRCAFAFNVKRGNGVIHAWKERLFAWNPKINDFELIEEEVFLPEHELYLY